MWEEEEGRQRDKMERDGARSEPYILDLVVQKFKCGESFQHSECGIEIPSETVPYSTPSMTKHQHKSKTNSIQSIA